MTDNKKRWEDHARFLGDMADRVAWLMVAQGADRTEAVNEYTRWLSEACFKHAERHCREDFDNGFYVPGKPVDEPLVNDISVSGDRVNRESLKLYPYPPAVKRDVSNIGSSWDEAKREAVDKPTIDDNDDSVIKTQEECARRFSHCDLCD